MENTQKQGVNLPHGPLAVTLYVCGCWIFIAGLLLQAAWVPGGPPAHIDNDDMMRLVEVRDLLDGQSWYDLTQYRLAPPDGVFMHWSRLIDLPIAGLILTLTPLLGALSAEHMALYLWPVLVLLPLLYVLSLLVQRLLGPDAIAPALLLAAMMTSILTNFSPGELDHHNVQLLLTLALVTALVGLPQSHAATGAGIAAAISLAIGMETLPFVALGILAVGLTWVAMGHTATHALRSFALTLATTTTLLFVLTVSPSRYLTATCDALSTVQLTAAYLVAGAYLLLAANNRTLSNWPRRLAAAAMLGIIATGVTIWAFPACIGDPYASLPPRLIEEWLAQVGEAKSLMEMAALRPSVTATNLLYPLTMLVAMFAAWRHSEADRRLGWMIAIAFLVLAVLLSFWQVRAAHFSNLLALPGAAWILVSIIRRTGTWSIAKRVPAVLATWFLCNNITFYLLLDAALTPLVPKVALNEGKAACGAAPALQALNSVSPPAVMINLLDLGAPILTHTPHAVMAGPYHRNIDGNLLAIDTFTLPLEQARQQALDSAATHLIYCIAMGEVKDWTARYPGSLIAQLEAGAAPDWLERISLPGETPLRLYRITRSRS